MCKNFVSTVQGSECATEKPREIQIFRDVTRPGEIRTFCALPVSYILFFLFYKQIMTKNIVRKCPFNIIRIRGPVVKRVFFFFVLNICSAGPNARVSL